MLLTWMDVAPEHDADFNRWYDREHIAERVGLPGFVSGARYLSTTERSPAYLALYRTSSLDVFRSHDYRQAFQHQTEQSVLNLGRMRNAMRRVCAIRSQIGLGLGGWLTVVPFGTRPPADAESCACQLGGALTDLDGVIASCLLVPDPELSTPLPMETRTGQTLESLFIIDASTRVAAAAAGAMSAITTGISQERIVVLQLLWQLQRGGTA